MLCAWGCKRSRVRIPAARRKKAQVNDLGLRSAPTAEGALVNYQSSVLREAHRTLRQPLLGHTWRHMLVDPQRDRDVGVAEHSGAPIINIPCD